MAEVCQSGGEGQETFPRLTTDRGLWQWQGGRTEKLRKPHPQDTGTQTLPKTEAESDSTEPIYLYHESSPSTKQEQSTSGEGASVEREPVWGTGMQVWLKAEMEGRVEHREKPFDRCLHSKHKAAYC